MNKNMMKMRISVLFLLGLILVVLNISKADLIGYVVTNSSDPQTDYSELYLINFTTRAKILIGGTGIELMRGLEFSPFSAKLYGMPA